MVTNSEAGRQLAALRKRRIKVCPICGVEFEAIGKQAYDSKLCANKASYRRRRQRAASTDRGAEHG